MTAGRKMAAVPSKPKSADAAADALAEYRRKRRFGETPEPDGSAPAKGKAAGSKAPALRFVVQKHQASHLHYDFRLELDGVLKSWAVPKGPSLDPAEKRLAMQVEDHPLAYFDFEGVIPPDNYGAGTVQVWDVGTWEPLSPKPVAGQLVATTTEEARQELATGDLKIRLTGKRLQGDFALVHIKPRAGARSSGKNNEWLLIKKKDGFARTGHDAEDEYTSVLTGRSMREIAGDKGSAQWKSRPAGTGKLKAAWLAEALEKRKALAAGGAKPVAAKAGGAKVAIPAKAEEKPPIPGAGRAAMPTAVRPMLATLEERVPTEDAKQPKWLYEIKWDGYRAVVFVDRTDARQPKVRLVSRNQNDMTGQFSELAAMAEHCKAKTAVLDGEIVALDEEGRSSFSRMQQRTGFRPHWTQGKAHPRAAREAGIPVVYYAFDLLYCDGWDLRGCAIEDRKKMLAGLIRPNPLLHYSDHVLGHGAEFLQLARQRGLEGAVAKRLGSRYQETRSRDWLKLKITQRVECVIGGYTDPEGSRKHFGSIVLGLYDEGGKLVPVGQAGSGFDERGLGEVWKLLQERASAKNPFSGPVESPRKTHWVKPELVAEIQFGEWTQEAGAGAHLRAPVFLGLRLDKDARECTLANGSGAAASK